MGETTGLTEPANAMQLQFAILARDAFQLAEDAVKGKVPGLDPKIESTFFVRSAARGETPKQIAGRKRVRSALPYLLGAAGTLGAGALWYFGAPIIAPVALLAGSLWYARRRAHTNVSGYDHDHVAGCACRKGHESEEEARR